MRRSTGLLVATTATVVTGSFVLFYRHCQKNSTNKRDETTRIPGPEEDPRTNKNTSYYDQSNHPPATYHQDTTVTGTYYQGGAIQTTIVSQDNPGKQPLELSEEGSALVISRLQARGRDDDTTSIVSRFLEMRTGRPNNEKATASLLLVHQENNSSRLGGLTTDKAAPPCWMLAGDDHTIDNMSNNMSHNNNMATPSTIVVDDDDATTIASGSTCNADSFSTLAVNAQQGIPHHPNKQNGLTRRLFQLAFRRINWLGQNSNVSVNNNNNNNMQWNKLNVTKKNHKMASHHPTRRRQNITEFFV